jgi:hypothetical protein
MEPRVLDEDGVFLERQKVATPPFHQETPMKLSKPDNHAAAAAHQGTGSLVRDRFESALLAWLLVGRDDYPGTLPH